jgi:uncharacterized protein (TIGR03083 family)
MPAVELSPPDALRSRVLAASLTRRAPDRGIPVVTPTEPAACFHHRVRELHRVLASVPPGGWSRPAWPYPWSVHGLLGHLVGVESYLGGVLGLWPFEPTCAEEDHIGITLPFVAEAEKSDACTSVGRWVARAEVVGTHLGRLQRQDPERRVTFHGISVPVGSLLVARAFELWTHTDDILRAIGRPLDTPPPGEVATMADLSMRLVAASTPLVAPRQAERPARVVLTGAGGGVWRLGPAEATPEVRVVAGIVDWCRMAARRLDPGELGAIIDGDRELAGDLFTAARLLIA